MSASFTREPDVTEYRGAIVAASATATATAMGIMLVLDSGWPSTEKGGSLARWYHLHGEILGWRALTVSLAAAAVIAFAASFRERTWALVPDRLWAGTLMVLAALGYAALNAVAGAVDVALLSTLLSSTEASPELMVLATSLHRALLIVATPALVVVLLGASVPLLRWGTAGRLTAGLAVVASGLLATPMTWQLGRSVTAVWFLLAGAVILFTRPSIAPLLMETAEDRSVEAPPRTAED